MYAYHLKHLFAHCCSIVCRVLNFYLSASVTYSVPFVLILSGGKKEPSMEKWGKNNHGPDLYCRTVNAQIRHALTKENNFCVSE